MIGISLAAALSMGTLAGCGNSNENDGASNGNTAAGSGKTTEIVFWQLDSASTQPFYKQIIGEFEKQHPDIKVKMANIPEEGFFEKLNTAFAAGKGPDLWGGWYSPDEFARGYIAPLDEFIQRDNIDMKQFFQPISDLRTKGADGKYYGLPRDMSNAVVFYNKDLFDKYKVPYPTADWTLDDFRETAKKLTHPEDKVYGTDIFTSDFNAITGNPILWNMGGDVASDDGLTVKGFVDSQQMIDMFNYAQSIVKDGSDAPSSLMQTAGDAGPYSGGQVAMSVGALWGYNDVKEAKFKTGAVAFPKPSGSTHNYAWSEVISWYMNAKSEKKDATWEFMKYLSGAEVGKKVVDGNFRWGPAMPSVWKEAGLDQDELLKVFLEQAQLETKAPSYDRSRTWGEVASMFTEAYNAVVNPLDGKSYKDAKEVLAKTADDMQKKIDELKSQE